MQESSAKVFAAFIISSLRGAGGRHAGIPVRKCGAARRETYLRIALWRSTSGPWCRPGISSTSSEGHRALFVGFINFITLMGMGIAYKNIFNGVFIILAVALGVLKSKVNS
ncbi:MAG: hypothetical protein ACLVJO_04140 [[Clostridium] scindens]